MNINVLAIGDSSNTLLTLTKFVKKSKIHLIDFPRKGAGKVTYISEGIEFFESLKISKQVKKINKIKKKFDICIVMSWAAARVAYLAGLNYVMYFTGNDIKTPPFEKKPKDPYLKEPVYNLNFIESKFYRNVFNSAIACVTSSEPYFNHLLTYRKDGIRIDRSAVDTTVFNDKVEPIDRKKTKFTFFSPQRNGPEKGMDVIWKALPLCKTDFEVLMVNWFDERTTDEKDMIKELLKKTPPQIKFIPLIKREEMSRYYKFADAVLGQMRAGTLSGIEREAALFKKPVLCYSNSSLSDVIDGKVLKNTFEPKTQDPKKIAELIDKVVESKEFREKLAHDEYQYVKELADPHKCAAEWDELFEKLIKKHKSINRNVSKIKLCLLNLLALLVEELIYSRTLKEKNIQGWGKEEYERLMR